jgi:hypothetical protein
VTAGYPDPFTPQLLFEGPLGENGLDGGVGGLAPKMIAARSQFPEHDAAETYAALENLESEAEDVAVRLRLHVSDPGNLNPPPYHFSYCNPVSFSVKHGFLTEFSGLHDPIHAVLENEPAIPAAPGDHMVTNSFCSRKPTGASTAEGAVLVKLSPALPEVSLNPTNALACACQQVLTFTATVTEPYDLPPYTGQIVWEIEGPGDALNGPVLLPQQRRRWITRGADRQVQVRTGEVGGLSPCALASRTFRHKSPW